MTVEVRRYTKPAIWLHWIIAVLMSFMLVFGEDYIRVPNGASLAGWEPSAHASFGILILPLSLARLFLRLAHTPPALPATTPTVAVAFLTRRALGILCTADCDSSHRPVGYRALRCCPT